MEPKRILILGGGFGGVRAALDLTKEFGASAGGLYPQVKITLISDKHHFEYTPALYKLATGRSPIETCIPLGEIFGRKKIEFIVDEITGGSLSENVVFGKSGSRYRYDFLILALGAETSYFGIPGIEENSYSLKSVASALRLKNHLHELFNGHAGRSKGDLMARFQFVIVGGGPSGVELAGEIRHYARTLAEKHGIPENLVTVDILQAAPRLLPTMPEGVSKRAIHQLNKLGINIILSRAVTAEDTQGVYLKDIQLNSKTIIWTAGVRPSHIYAHLAGLSLDKGGRILVDEHLRANGTHGVFAIGDSASTPFSGTAQTAIYDGRYVAQVIAHSMRGKTIPQHAPRQIPYVVPIGAHWAVFTYKKIVLSGKLFWWLRQIIDLKYLLTILPLGKALNVWREGSSISESCPTCEEAQAQ